MTPSPKPAIGSWCASPRQTASWAASLGLRAKTDEADALTLARGLLAGLGRASTLPSESIQALRALTRARRDLIQARTAARRASGCTTNWWSSFPSCRACWPSCQAARTWAVPTCSAC
jgi:hypothetical protein